MTSAQEIIESILSEIKNTQTMPFYSTKETQEEEQKHLIEKRVKDLSSSIQKRVRAEFEGLGPLEVLLYDLSVTEIMLNDRHSIYFEKEGEITRHKDVFLSEISFNLFLNRMAKEGVPEASFERPFVDGFWRGFRVHFSYGGVCSRGHTITLRRICRSNWTLDDLFKSKWATTESIDLIRTLLINRKNILIVGSTGAGKTTLISALLNDLPNNERCILLEDSDELPLPNSVSTKLLTRRDSKKILADINLDELVRNSLRMRPDRIVVGECRGGEAKDLLLSLATGHSGCLASLHARSGSDALIRLEMLIQIGAPQWSLQAVRRLISMSLDYILSVRIDKDGLRKLYRIERIASFEEFGVTLETEWEIEPSLNN